MRFAGGESSGPQVNGVIGEPYRMGRQLRWGRRGPSSPPKKLKQRGQALVEFALILPIFLLLLLAAVDFGRAYFTLQVVNNASREGARRGIIPGTVTSDVTTIVQSRLTSGGLAATPTITVTNVDGAGAGAETSVSVSYPFTTLTGTIIPGWTGTITLSQTTVMRHE